MSITATVDGTAYNGVETITTGGKTIALTESGGGGSVGGLTEYNTITQKVTQESLGTGATGIIIEHGLTKAPKIVSMKIDKTFTTDYKGIEVGFMYCGVEENENGYGGNVFTNSSTGNISVGRMTKVTTFNGNAQFLIDDTYVKIGKSGNAYNFDPDENYIFEFYV